MTNFSNILKPKNLIEVYPHVSKKVNEFMESHNVYKPQVNPGRRYHKHLNFLNDLSNKVNANSNTFYLLSDYVSQEEIKVFVSNIYDINFKKLNYKRVIIPHRLNSLFCFIPNKRIVIEKAENIRWHNNHIDLYWKFNVWVDLLFFLRYSNEKYREFRKKEDDKRHKYQKQLMINISNDLNKIKTLYG